jgi:hypothetical protein
MKAHHGPVRGGTLSPQADDITRTRPRTPEPQSDAVKPDARAMQFADAGPDDPRIATDILPVLRELRPDLTPHPSRRSTLKGIPRACGSPPPT